MCKHMCVRICIAIYMNQEIAGHRVQREMVNVNNTYKTFGWKKCIREDRVQNEN